MFYLFKKRFLQVLVFALQLLIHLSHVVTLELRIHLRELIKEVVQLLYQTFDKVLVSLKPQPF